MKSEKGKVYGKLYKCRFCHQLFPRYEDWFEHQKTCRGLIPTYVSSMWFCMILSDRDIKSYMRQGRIRIKPMAKIKTNGIDLTIADDIGIDVSVTHKAIDPTDKMSIHSSYEIQKIPREGYLMEPREFYLLRTRERVTIDNSLVGITKLKSTWARLGLLIPPTVINAGSSGDIVAEVFNFRNAPLLIKRGMPFLHILFERLSSKVSSSYSSVGSYYGQRGIRLPNPIKP